MADLKLEIALAGAAARGHPVSGDLEVVHSFADGSGVLLAVIDGIGHGEQAAVSARLAADTLLRHPQDPPELLLKRCHTALRATRGVVMSIAVIDLRRATVTWCGIGNVIGALYHAGANMLEGHAELLLRPGVVGLGELPAPAVSAMPLRARDTLIFATDGIGRHFVDGLPPGPGPQDLANEIVARHHRDNDDALVLVARTS
jgi:negative regulator of sigma-B (phosphoserine phosphatase)